MKVPPEKSVFIFVKETIPQSGVLIEQLYNKYKDEDGFLYVSYSGESTFGNTTTLN